MARRPTTAHRCTVCDSSTTTWRGRCPSCGEWGTLEPAGSGPGPDGTGAPVRGEVRALADVAGDTTALVRTDIDELDRVLGGGFVPGSVTLLGGEPGIGKSTLLLQLLAGIAGSGERTLLVTAEESVGQVGRRAARLGAAADGVHVVAETSLAAVIAHLDHERPAVAVVDSVQTVLDPEVGSAAGSVAQVREVAQRLVEVARRRGTTLVLVGHVTKDGGLAGPRALEHLVDTVLSLEGDRSHQLRLLRAVKHRFGSTDELGVFEMRVDGLVGVADPSARLLDDRRVDVPGSVVVAGLDGHRPMLVEIQALTAASGLPQPRRSAQGVDQGRLSMLLAVLQRRVGVHLMGDDVFVSAVGGLTVRETGADLGVMLAIASAAGATPVPADLVVCGEVGLAGEVRRVSQTRRRLTEAARLGFRHAVVPAGAVGDVPDAISARPVADVRQALVAAGLTAAMTTTAPPLRARRGA